MATTVENTFGTSLLKETTGPVYKIDTYKQTNKQNLSHHFSYTSLFEQNVGNTLLNN